MSKINKTKYAILGVLSITPGSGYDIKKFCDQSISHFWNENFGHIYPVLKQIEAEELITKEVEYTEGKPPRNVFYITEKGKKELAEWLQQPAEQNPVRIEPLLKLFFAKELSYEKISEMLDKEKSNCILQIEKYSAIEKMLMKEDGIQDEKSRILWLSTVRYGLSDARARLEWCEQTLGDFEKLRNSEV